MYVKTRLLTVLMNDSLSCSKRDFFGAFVLILVLPCALVSGVYIG